jgi:hypothetical protein
MPLGLSVWLCFDGISLSSLLYASGISMWASGAVNLLWWCCPMPSALVCARWLYGNKLKALPPEPHQNMD